MSLNVGVIGLGVGYHHVRAYQQSSLCRVVAVCDQSEEMRRRFAEKHPDIPVVATATEILEDPKIHIVSVASYDDAHADQVERALRSGKHVFVEKPLCLHREEAVRIRSVLRENAGLRLSSNLNLRTCPRFAHLRERMGRSELGEIFYLEADYLWGRREKLTDGWRGRLPYYSIILGASIHMVDLLLWLVGRRPVEVVSMGNRIATAGTGFRFDDFNVMLIRWENGLVAKVMSSGGCVHPHFHRLWVYGTAETFIHDSLASGRVVSPDPARPPEVVEGDYPAREHKGRLILSFVESIAEPSHASLVSEEDVFNALSVCFAAIDSLQSGTVVRIEYL